MSLTGDVLGQIGAEVSLNGGVGGTIEFTGEGTDNYDELDNRPSINGVVLTGNKTTEDLHIDTGGTDDYLDLNNKPKINSVTLRGDVSSASLQISYNDLTDRPVIPDLTDLENRMDAVEGDIQSIETDIGDIGDRLIDIASDIATIQATDLVQNSDISSLKNRMNAAETSITNLGSRLTTAEGTISTHTTDISDLDNRLDTAEDNISDAQNDISDLQGDVTSLDTIVGDGQQTVGTDLTDAVTQLNSSLIGGKYGYMNWNDISVSSGSWATNTGNNSTGMKPSKGSMQNAYNLTLDIEGQYLVVYKATFNDSNNKTGLRGIRYYINETNSGEEFTAPAGNTTSITACRMVESNGNTTVRMGLFQSSGNTVTATKIQIIALYMGQ